MMFQSCRPPAFSRRFEDDNGRNHTMRGHSHPWQAAPDRDGLALFFRAQPPKAGSIAPKCWLCFFKSDHLLQGGHVSLGIPG
jgi:hypothetical protein